MYFHLLMTEMCNAQCKYCYEKSFQEFDNGLDKKFKFDFSAPAHTQVDPEKLKKFLSQDKNPVLIFYGGEPLLKIKKIKEIIGSLSDTNTRFCMQTNAKLIDKIPIEYLNKFARILISIDGNKARTDFNRGDGTFDLVVKKLKSIRENGFSGELVSRMTLSPLPKSEIDPSDIFEQGKFLLDLGVFDSLHWQIDAGFYKYDFHKKDFSDFVKKYNSSISKFVDYWVSEMKKGKVLKIYPFLGIFENLFHNKKTKLMCGAGYEGYAITTDGKITSCPIMNSITDFYAGDLSSKISELKKFDVVEPCLSCKYLGNCGGRCLYSNHAKLWPEDGQKLICDTIIFLIEKIKSKIPEIKKLISEGKIKLSDFEYEKYFGPEIIP